MIETTLTLRADAPIGTISPRLYGHFAEHLGRCCYDGLWVGLEQKDIPHYEGFRADVVEALKLLPVPLLRWPGGCYADHYHWRDGIGAPAQRPIRLGMSCGLQVEDSNALGTHEFLALCRMLGAEPYLAGNVGSGTVQEMCDWLEYCNSTVASSLARERAANGSPAAFGVKLWGVGNENWGCGGHFDAYSYAIEYRRYATMLQHVDPTAELVACGHDDDWNKAFIQANQRHLWLMNHFSIHRYWINGGPETGFSEQQYYELLTEAHETEDFVVRTAGYLHEAQAGSNEQRNKRKIGIALDEWGVWHPEAREWGPDGELHRDPNTYEQANTLRDALAAAVALEGFHRQCDVLTLANLAQIVNVLQSVLMTDGGQMWLTPTYYALQLHLPHLGATAIPVEVTHGTAQPHSGSQQISAVTATASLKDKATALTLINRHYDQAASVTLNAPASSVKIAQLLAADDPRAQNSAAQPDRVKPVALPVHADGTGRWRIELPAHSMATVVLE
ncbi:MAG: alpha-N-arabinofuranosidase [Anaerolineae bacterium]|nr:alpha-N-arabinofuranosidase [Anaerolineae bacterium]